MTDSILDAVWLHDHIALYKADPVAAHDWDSTPVGGNGIVPTLLLTTTGRVSGKPRLVPLLYQPSGVGFLVAGSKGGSDTHPQWFQNLIADPACEIQVGRRSYSGKASLVSGERRAPYWDLLTRVWPDYLRYQGRTEREIPVVELCIEDELS